MTVLTITILLLLLLGSLLVLLFVGGAGQGAVRIAMIIASIAFLGDGEDAVEVVTDGAWKALRAFYGLQGPPLPRKAAPRSLKRLL